MAKRPDEIKPINALFDDVAKKLESDARPLDKKFEDALGRISTTESSGLTDASIPGIMKTNLIHNQSVLTDTIFLGFPFHYFYSALFLLTLFVLICLVYCFKIDTLMKKYDMEQS